MTAILMSTYNGQSYLKEQLDSILNQTFSDFVLYIRDDGSKDQTVSLIRSYDDPRIRLIEGENVGPAKSFFSLLHAAQDADYIFFSDQDDVWFPNKLERLLSEIRKYDHIPAMVFSDFSMIDNAGGVIAESYAKKASLQVSPGDNTLAKVLAHPYVFGCASVINKNLSRLVANPPEGIEMHDCWICQCAAATGKLIYLPEQTIGHRFHNSNATGRMGQDTLVSRLKRFSTGFKAQVENTELRLRQVSLLLSHNKERLLPEAEKLLIELHRSFRKNRVSVVYALHKNGVTRQRWFNTLFFYITVLWTKGDFE